jgi:hypothetical protein
MQRSCRSILRRCIIIQERRKAWGYTYDRDHRLEGNCRSSNLGRVEKQVLIPDHITRYDCLLGFRVIENPCLVILWVANEGALSSVGLSLGTLVPLHMHISFAAPDTQVGYIRLGAIPKLMGCLITTSASHPEN